MLIIFDHSVEWGPKVSDAQEDACLTKETTGLKEGGGVWTWTNYHPSIPKTNSSIRAGNMERRHGFGTRDQKIQGYCLEISVQYVAE